MSAAPRRLTPARLAAAALLVMVLATFAAALPQASVLFERDVHAYWYPQRAALRAALLEGSVPLWNPWVGFGAPFLADASSELAYPPTWLLLPFPLPLQFELVTIGHALLAAAGAAALTRRLLGGVLPAAVAGAAYALAGPMLSAASLYHHFAGAALMPWVLWGLERLLQRRDARSALVLGALSAGQVLAGSGDLVLMTALAALGLVALDLRRAGAPGLAGLLRPLALAAALALSISAVQWLPTLERGQSGLRAAQDFRTRTYWSLHPASLFDLAVPGLVSGAELRPSEREAFFEGREPLLSSLYLGVTTLALGALALILLQPPAAALAAGAASFVLLSLGRHTPLYALLLELPGFGLLRYPQKYLLPASLCLALLAALGAKALGRSWSAGERRRARVFAVALVALALSAATAALLLPQDARGSVAGLKLGRSALLLALVGWLVTRRSASVASRPGATAVLMLLGAIDLVVVGRGTVPVAPAALYEHRPAVLDRLAGTSGRVHAATESAACLVPAEGPPGWGRAAVAALGFLDTLRPPAGIRWGLFGSYDGEFTGLGPRFTAAFSEIVRSGLATPAGLRLLQLGGVEHVLYLGHIAPAGLEHVATLATPYACPLQLLRVPGALPGAFVVGHELQDRGDALAAVLDPAFDPSRQVLLAGSPAVTRAAGGAAAARVRSRTANTLEVVTELLAPGVLVVTEAFDEGWSAEVDGRPAEVLRANGLFRAVRLDAGPHEVRFRYRPWPARAGAALSAAGLAGAVLLGLRLGRGGRD